ncbi:SDR family oxidoreductase [Caballeronia grimmiae]|uniref:SDR family oxidoreductase n=1 Tax=Caballeronia grimmiae TaxID=1071679 RepID=UPI0038BD41D9
MRLSGAEAPLGDCSRNALGRKLTLLLEERAANYEGKALEHRTLNWFDYCAWKHRVTHTTAFGRAQSYWTNKLEGMTLRVELPCDFATRRANANCVIPMHLTQEQAGELRNISQARGTTLSPVLFAVHLVWLWGVSGQATLASGYPQAGRDVPGSESVYGMRVSCGAHVHHPHGYGSLKAANVGGTEALLQLALSVRMKPMCFLSTMSVPMMSEGTTRVEERIASGRPQSDNGYLLGKWVSEQRVLAYSRAHGLPATVVRVGNVTGHAETGYSNYRQNHFWLFNQGCIQLGAYPATGKPSR